MKTYLKSIIAEFDTRTWSRADWARWYFASILFMCFFFIMGSYFVTTRPAAILAPTLGYCLGVFWLISAFISRRRRNNYSEEKV